MKSYDCHMLMQEYLPIALRGTLPEHASSVIIELCEFFRTICYKDLSEVNLHFLESKVALTLCKLEKIFPPSFFTVMVHLVIHLTREVKLGGPVAFRWMYPIERDLLKLKSYVHNSAHPEGSIAEGYLANESITFCSRYLSKVETVFTRAIRNDDEGNQNHIEESNNLCPGRAIGRKLDSGVSIRKRRSSNSNWIFHSMGKKWRTWKGSLKARAYDPSLTIDEIVAQQTKKDNRVDEAQFKKLVTSWFNPEYQSTCDVKRLSHSKMKEPHVTGTKSFARLAHEVAKNNNGVYPTRGEMYITTRTRKDGRIVDDKAAEVVASLKAISSESSSTLGDVDFTNDDYSKVKGPEKSGYVRLVGRMPATKTKGDTGTSKDSEKINQLTNVVNFMLNIIQEHIPNANMSAILGNMNIQGSSFPNNSLSVNQPSSSRSHNNNGK